MDTLLVGEDEPQTSHTYRTGRGTKLFIVQALLGGYGGVFVGLRAHAWWTPLLVLGAIVATDTFRGLWFMSVETDAIGLTVRIPGFPKAMIPSIRWSEISEVRATPWPWPVSRHFRNFLLVSDSTRKEVSSIIISGMKDTTSLLRTIVASAPRAEVDQSIRERVASG